MKRKSWALMARPRSLRFWRRVSSDEVMNQSRISTSAGGSTLSWRVAGMSMDASRESTALMV